MSKAPPPAKRVIVTPRMLRAGALALATLGEVGDYELVGAVYRAMAAVAPPTKAADPPQQPANFLEVMRLMSSGRRDV
jgi:cytochrome c-type biogenesis protein CcmH/NrfG